MNGDAFWFALSLLTGLIAIAPWDTHHPKANLHVFRIVYMFFSSACLFLALAL
jgi:hypothetical protein